MSNLYLRGLLLVTVLELLLRVKAPKESSISEVLLSFSAGSLLCCNRIGGLSGREQRETDEGDERGDAADIHGMICSGMTQLIFGATVALKQ